MASNVETTPDTAAHRKTPSYELEQKSTSREKYGKLNMAKQYDIDQGPATPPEKWKPRPRTTGRQNGYKYPPLSPFQQAKGSPFQQVSPSTSSTDLRGDGNSHLAQDPPPETQTASPAWYDSASEPTAGGRATDAEEMPTGALAALQSMAATVSNNFALWGSYITDFVADVAGDDTEEEITAAEQQRQAAKEASKKNQGSVTGDIAQPLTRRHSRTSSVRLSRGASLRLDGDWQITPAKSAPISGLLGHEEIGEDGEPEIAKKDS